MKNQYLQMIRGVCIICVILIHSISKEINIHNNELNIAIRTIINFAVGVFVFLSGYFVKPDEIKKNMKTYYKRRAKRVLIPYIIWSIIYIFLFNFKYIKTFNIKKLINMFVLGNSSAQMYYIIVLLQLIAITPLLLKLANKNSKVINLFLLSITPIYTLINGFYNYYFHNNIYLYATLFLAWITFYYLGIIFKQKKIEFYKYRMVIILCGVILSLVFGIIINIFEYNNGLKYGYCVSQVKFTNSIYVLFVILTIVFMQNKIMFFETLTTIFVKAML